MSTNADTIHMLLALKQKLEALGRSGGAPGPGDVHPGVSMNLDQAAEALRTGSDPQGKPITPLQVADGLKRLAAYVNTTDWFRIAGGTVRPGGMDLLKTYVYDLTVIANGIGQEDTPDVLATAFRTPPHAAANILTPRATQTPFSPIVLVAVFLGLLVAGAGLFTMLRQSGPPAAHRPTVNDRAETTTATPPPPAEPPPVERAPADRAVVPPRQP